MADATLTPAATDLIDILTATCNQPGKDWLSSIFEGRRERDTDLPKEPA